MALTLYDNPESTNALKVRFALAEMGVRTTTVLVPLEGERPPEYRHVHPFALVPALVDGPLTLTESNTMLRYLAEREGRGDLRGADPVRRARVDGLLDTLSLELRPKLWALEEVDVYGLAVAPEERAARVAALTEALVAFDSLLDATGPYALGALTVADFALAGRGLHLPQLGVAAATAPRLRRCLEAAWARPAWAAATSSAPPARSPP